MAVLVLLLSAVLGTGFLATRLSKMLRIPHSVLLVLLGIVAGWLARSAGFAPSAEAWHEFPEVVLYVLLPPLVFDSAYHMDVEELKRDRWPLLFLAVFALLGSCLLVGTGLHYGLGMEWQPALLFGALISATDPVAVVALFRELGARERLTLLVEGESLFNDGTAIVLFRVLLMGAAGGNLIIHGGLRFLAVSLGGVLVGLIFSLLFRFLFRFTADSSGQAQIGLTLTAAYVSFVVADHWLGASGVLATLTVGLYLGARARLTLNPEALKSMHTIWDFFALCANTVIFLAVGLSVDSELLAGAWTSVPLTLVVVYLARTLSVLASLATVNQLGLCARIPRGEQLVVVWGGLRGGLALALVLLLPDSFPQKDLFLALATTVVLATLLGNALSISWLLRRLGLNRLTEAEEDFLGHSMAHAVDDAFGWLQRTADRGGISTQLVEHMRKQAQQCLPHAPSETPLAFAVRQLLSAEQEHYDRQMDLGILSTTAYLRLSKFVRSRLAALEVGVEGLDKVSFRPQQDSHLELTLELLLHLSLALEAFPPSALPELETLRACWLSQVRSQLDTFQCSHPTLGTAVQSDFLAQTVTSSAEHALQHLLESKIINPTVYARASQDLSRFRTQVETETQHLRNLTFRGVLERVPLFARLTAEELAQVEEHSRRQHLEAGTVLFREGDAGDSLFVILSGIVKVDSSCQQSRAPRLFAGSFLGELSLLFEVPRTATVTALVDTDVVEIELPLFHHLQNLSKAFQEHVCRIAKERALQAGLSRETRVMPAPTPEELAK